MSSTILGVILLGVLGLALTIFGLGKLFHWHKHDWICLRVMRFTDVSWTEAHLEYGLPMTRIYWKCKKCLKVSISCIDGNWQESDFKRE